MRQILRKNWYKETRKPQRHVAHIALKQPTAISRTSNPRIKRAILQTRKGWYIHHTQYRYAHIAIQMWKNEWGIRSAQVLEILKHGNINYKTDNGQNTIRVELNIYLRGHGQDCNTTRDIIKIPIKQPEIPDPAMLGAKEQEAISQIMLKLPEIARKVHDTQQHG